MLGSIEELEKGIEEFQRNIAASGEVVALLQQMVEQIKAQNNAFDQQSKALVSRLDSIPNTIDSANSESNRAIKNNVSSEMENALMKFSSEQNKYVSSLSETREKINSLVENLRHQETMSSERTNSLLDKMDHVLEQLLLKIESANDRLKQELIKVIDERNSNFIKEQSGYISEVKKTQDQIRTCEEQLNVRYSGFISTLEKMNISNLYEQNVELKNEVKKRTMAIAIIAVVSVVASIIGIIL